MAVRVLSGAARIAPTDGGAGGCAGVSSEKAGCARPLRRGNVGPSAPASGEAQEGCAPAAMAARGAPRGRRCALAVATDAGGGAARGRLRVEAGGERRVSRDSAAGAGRHVSHLWAVQLSKSLPWAPMFQAPVRRRRDQSPRSGRLCFPAPEGSSGSARGSRSRFETHTKRSCPRSERVVPAQRRPCRRRSVHLG